jgi:hypothetical protein
MPAQIRATPTGCVMKSSPDLRRWSAWCSHANTNALQDLGAVDRLGDLVGVLLDDREQVPEQLALEVGEIRRQLERRLGAVVHVQRAADLDVPGHDHPVTVARQAVAVRLGQAARRIGCRLLRNRRPSSRRRW